MSGSQSTSRTPRTAVLAGAGVAGLASLLAFAPLAHAAPVEPKISQPSDGTGTTSASTDDAPAPDVQANYGYKKIRIGVQQKDGSYVPPTSTTVGTKITITQTNPDFSKPDVTQCETAADTRISSDAASASFCVFQDNDRLQGLSKRQLKAITKPVDGLNTPPDQAYVISPGSTVVIEQTAANAGYLVDPASPVTVEPCEDPVPARRAAAAAAAPSCDSEQVILEDPGIPPVATNDSAKTKEGVAVTIDIAPNDTAKAPITSVKIVADPKDGTARLITAEEPDPAPSSSAATTPPIEMKAPAGSRSLAAVTSYRAIYTPKPGFIGIDTFDYTIATANGTATARVTVTVTGVAASSSASAAASSNADAVAETGAPSGQLLGYGVALVVAGGGAVALGTKRRRGRHAR